MAWVEGITTTAGDPWVLEQGIDGFVQFSMFQDDAEAVKWPLPYGDVNAVLADEKQREKWPLTPVVDFLNGVVTVIIPEAIVNSLRTGRTYVLDIIMVAPGATQADDAHLAFIPLTVAPRPARRDP